MTAAALRSARDQFVRDAELLDLIQQLEEMDEQLVDARGYIPDEFIDTTNDARAVIAKAITYLLELRYRNGGAAP